jgi:hypothetical protein
MTNNQDDARPKPAKDPYAFYMRNRRGWHRLSLEQMVEFHDTRVRRLLELINQEDGPGKRKYNYYWWTDLIEQIRDSINRRLEEEARSSGAPRRYWTQVCEEPK